MANREVVEIPGALREEERFAFKEDAKGVEKRMKDAMESDAHIPEAQAEAEAEALEQRAQEAKDNAEMRTNVRTQRARAVLGEAQAPKAQAAERRPQEQPAAREARESGSGKSSGKGG